jgi:hypothetical protein
MSIPKIMTGSLTRQNLRVVDEAVSYGQVRPDKQGNGIGDGLVSKQDIKTALTHWPEFSATLPKQWDKDKKEQLHSYLSRLDRISRQQANDVMMDYRSPEPTAKKPSASPSVTGTEVKPKSITFAQFFGF